MMTNSNKVQPSGLNRGFTLIELMVVMLLISIVLAVVIPRFDGGPFQDPMKKFSRWMINTVRHLRSAAVQKQKIQTMVVDLGSQRIWFTSGESSADDGSEDAAVAQKNAYAIDKSMHITNIQFPKKDPVASGIVEIRFYPEGFSDQVLIHLEDNDAERRSFLLEPLLPKVKIFDTWIDL
jgi:prepilin-type N-terminal cleavage/methylation domain-containing protein